MTEDIASRIGIITFTDDRDVGLYSEEVEEHLRKKHEELKRFLVKEGIMVIDPLKKIRKKGELPFGVRNIKDIRKVLDILLPQGIDGLIIGAWNWAPPMLVMDFVRKLGKPILYYTENDPMMGSLSHMSATCSSMMEWGSNTFALIHERCFGNRERLLKWSKAVRAFSRMRESALLLWGGSYSVKMEQLQDDVPRLKSFMVRDILNEDQYILIKRAESIIKGEPERIESFRKWLISNGLKINYDKKMLTPESLDKQIALLLAARQRLDELENENIGGVSIKCQPEIYNEFGVNACTLPAFLPFASNESGNQKIYPTVCEGDIKGLLTSMLLHFLNPGVPPAFGDLISVDDKHIEFANCGAGSLFWAANSLDPGEVFQNVEAKSNIHGISGAAFSYYGRMAPSVTVARLTRVRGEYYMQVGCGKELDAREFLTSMLGEGVNHHLGQAWGKIVVDLDVKGENFVRCIGANHLSATMGNLIEEIEIVCRLWGIPVVRIDSDYEMERFYSSVRYKQF
ncbi:MAG: hypothetical protein ACUVWJ_05995 [Spirochaetota bacterium]|uniref:hypothetical protein n=1 Tax=Candidatus Jordarchaeum sp. TaxID=2823881 RepID=UPI0040490526